MPDFQVETWFAFYGPANMPKDIVSAINTALNSTLQNADAARQFVKVGLDPKVSTLEESQALLRAESNKWGNVIRQIGLQVE